MRTLATLYFEDGIETERALLLANQAFGLVNRPQWPDIYLKTMVAQDTRSPDSKQLIERLRHAIGAPLHP